MNPLKAAVLLGFGIVILKAPRITSQVVAQSQASFARGVSTGFMSAGVQPQLDSHFSWPVWEAESRGLDVRLTDKCPQEPSKGAVKCTAFPDIPEASWTPICDL